MNREEERLWAIGHYAARGFDLDANSMGDGRLIAFGAYIEKGVTDAQKAYPPPPKYSIRSPDELELILRRRKEGEASADAWRGLAGEPILIERDPWWKFWRWL